MTARLGAKVFPPLACYVMGLWALLRSYWPLQDMLNNPGIPSFCPVPNHALKRACCNIAGTSAGALLQGIGEASSRSASPAQERAGGSCGVMLSRGGSSRQGGQGLRSGSPRDSTRIWLGGGSQGGHLRPDTMQREQGIRQAPEERAEGALKAAEAGLLIAHLMIAVQALRRICHSCIVVAAVHIVLSLLHYF